MTSNSQERAWRINESLESISTEETLKEEVILKLMIKWNIAKRVAREYIDVLIAKGLVRGGKTLWRVEKN